MSLWKFIESKLHELGHDQLWLADKCGFSTLTVNRIRHGGQIKNGTKQKLALALGCSIGDINAAIAERDLPQPKPEYLDLTVGKIPENVKAVIDDYMAHEPKKVPAEKIKWYPNQEPIEMPTRGPLTRITEPEVTVIAVEQYKQKLKNIILEQVFTFDDTSYGIEELFGQIGKAVMKELMK